MPGKDISRCTPACCELAAALHRACFDFPWPVEAFASLLALPATVGWISEKALLICSFAADEMEILTLCVMPASRRQGIAEVFLDALFDYADKQGVRRIFLEVSVKNTPAVRLYLKKGFHKIGCRKNYYKTQAGFCDAVCMEKTLPARHGAESE